MGQFVESIVMIRVREMCEHKGKEEKRRDRWGLLMSLGQYYYIRLFCVISFKGHSYIGVTKTHFLFVCLDTLLYRVYVSN